MKIDPSVSRRICILRTILIMFVVLLHTGTLEVRELDYGDKLQLFRFFFQNELGRLSVPTLTMISGYLLFSSKLDLMPLQLYKKKAATLLIPFFFFNIVYYAVQYALEYTTGWAPLYPLVGKPAWMNLNYLFNYDGIPLNASVHFLRDLFVLVLLAPLFGYCIRHLPLVGLAAVAGIFMCDLDGHMINRNTMPVLFYVGGMAAVGNWNVKRFDHLAIPALATLFMVCVGTMYYRVEEYVYIYLTAPFAVWPAAARLLDTRIGVLAEKYSKYSFFLFLAHAPLIRVIELARTKYLPHLADGPYIALAFVLVVVLVPLLYQAAMYVMPDTFSFMIGRRAGKAPADRAPQALGGMLVNG